MSIKSEFSEHANDYDGNNIIQRIVSRALVREIQNNPTKILELGCGSGQVYRQIDWDLEYYKAIDFSSDMCELHPQDKNLEVKCFDFDSQDFFNEIKNEKYDLILSSSAMQWSKNLPLLLKNLMATTKTFNGVLFTSNTFKSIYKITKQKKAILSLEEIQSAFDKYNATYEVFNYKLEFESKKELFSYIKNSGVKGEVSLSFKDAKHLYKNYDLNYLEFEVVFIKVTDYQK
jgi:malonyl-CoA O-methyltransferase